MRLLFIFGNNKLFLKIIFGAKGSEIELFWGRFNRNETIRINFHSLVGPIKIVNRNIVIKESFY